MYRQFIEHPEWIPDDIKRRSDVRAGADKGRIYRVYPKGAALRRFTRLSGLDGPGLVKAMDHPNGWQRDTAQRLLVTRTDKSAIEPLRVLLGSSSNPKARLTALCTLDGLNSLRADDLIQCLKDPHPALREHAVRISETRLRPQTPAPLIDAVLARVEDENLRVRFQLALSLGEYDHPRAAQALARLALRDAQQPDVITAILSSCAKRPGEILEALFASGSDLAPLERLTSHLVMWVVGQGQTPETGKLVAKLTQPAGPNGFHAAWQISAFARLLAELEKNKHALGEINGASAALPALLASARSLVQDSNVATERRATALALLGRQPGNERNDVDLLASLLQPQVPDSLQQAALTRLGQISSDTVPAAVTRGWSGLAPGLRAQALELLLRRERWVQLFLDRLEAKEIAAHDLGAGARQRLLSHPNETLRQRAQKTLEQPIDRERQKLVASYLPEVQKATGDASRGAAIFTTHCAACHRLRGQGNGAAPDLASVVDRSPERMLIAILDPNRAVEDRFINYLVTTKGGEELSGILAGETANSITLVAASGTRETILRSDVASLRSTRLSLMPEGFEQLLKPQDIANLLSYIDANAAPPRSFPGNQPVLVKADENGALRLRSINAEIYGEGIAFETQYHNLGSWNGANDRAIWSVEVPAPAAYDVWLHWACHDNEAGDRFRFQIAGQSFVAQVPGTKTWDLYKHAKFSRIEVPSGKHRAVFQAEGTLTNYLIDLLEIRLVPANAAKPPEFEQVGTGYRQAAVPKNR